MMNPAEFATIRAHEEHFWWYRGMRRILFRMLDPMLAGRRTERVLEAGCGTGYFSQLLQRQCRWPAIPLDLSSEGLRYARELGVERPVQADITALPFAGDAFDLVFALDVLTHLPRGAERRAFRELARVAAPGGLIVIRTSALDILRSRHSEHVLERQRYTRGRLLDDMTAAGIRILRCTYANSILLPVALAKFRIWEPLTGAAPETGVQSAPPWLDRLLYAALTAEAAWIGGGHTFPLGQSLIAIGEKMVQSG